MDKIGKIYKRIGEAIKNGRGVRLTYEELTTFAEMDDAVGMALTGVMGVDSWDDLIR